MRRAVRKKKIPKIKYKAVLLISFGEETAITN